MKVGMTREGSLWGWCLVGGGEGLVPLPGTSDAIVVLVISGTML